MRECAFNQFGLVKETFDAYTTLCDYDYMRPPSVMEVYAVARIVGNVPLWIRTERSTSKGWHVVIKWKNKMSPAEIVALQACLRSDVKRETMNLGRVMSIHGKRGESRWNLLFKAKLK